MSPQTGYSGPPRAADCPDHGVVVVWGHGPDVQHTDIYARRVSPSGGGWPNDPSGVAVCTAGGAQFDPCVVADADSGLYIAWTDLRNDYTLGLGADIYIQHLRGDGTLWEGWPVDGIPLCKVIGDQVEPALVSDGAGGAITIWRDLRAGNSDIYGAHIYADGTLDGSWALNGSAIVAYSGDQTHCMALSDGSGGAYLAFVDEAPTDTLILLHRIQESGFPAEGFPVLVNDDRYPTVRAMSLCRADDGGIYVAWNWIGPSRSGANVQQIGADGSHPWTGYGVTIGTGAVRGTAPAIQSDGAGGAFVAWNVEGGNGVDLRATRIDSRGALRPYWPASGVVVSDAVGDQLLPDWRSGAPPGGPIFPDGNGGFIVVWTDTRVPSDVDLYAQDVTRNGVVAPEQPPFCFEYCGQPDYVREARPNPTRGPLLLRAWLPENRVALIDVFDVQGKARGTQRIANLPGGSYMEIPVTLSGLPSGVYFLRYRLEGGPSDAALGTKRVVLLR